MDSGQRTNLEIIQASNRELLNYFNNAYIEDLEKIQDLETQSFEIDVKIDELKKTKDIYAFKSNSRKSVFTPIISDSNESERGKIIDDQIKDSEDVKESLETKIRMLELSLNTNRRRLEMLSDTEKAISALIDSELLQEKEEEISEEELEFVEPADDKDLVSHGYNILMHDAFQKTLLSTMLDRNVRDGLVSINHKLEMLSYLLGTDVSRAKLTLKEILNNSGNILTALDDLSEKLSCNIDSAKPIWSRLNDFIAQQKEQHPECAIETKIECTDHELNLHPVLTINLLQLLEIFFDNIFRHSNANKVDFQLSLSSNIVDVSIKDNGVGIGVDYMEQNPWYSSLHRAHEIVYLLDGTLEIYGDILSGTSVHFKFPIKDVKEQ